MHIEADFLGRSRPMFVAEAVDVFPIRVGVEGVVAGGDGAFVAEIVALRVLDLSYGGRDNQYMMGRGSYGRDAKARRTQKSTSRLPAPPNSLSPTWNVTVILSPLCSCSWKHSREWAPRLMLWDATRDVRRRAEVVKRLLRVRIVLDWGRVEEREGGSLSG